jgi:hypothetical protein
MEYIVFLLLIKLINAIKPKSNADLVNASFTNTFKSIVIAEPIRVLSPATVSFNKTFVITTDGPKAITSN